MFTVRAFTAFCNWFIGDPYRDLREARQSLKRPGPFTEDQIAQLERVSQVFLRQWPLLIDDSERLEQLLQHHLVQGTHLNLLEWRAIRARFLLHGSIIPLIQILKKEACINRLRTEILTFPHVRLDCENRCDGLVRWAHLLSLETIGETEIPFSPLLSLVQTDPQVPLSKTDESSIGKWIRALNQSNPALYGDPEGLYSRTLRVRLWAVLYWKKGDPPVKNDYIRLVGELHLRRLRWITEPDPGCLAFRHAMDMGTELRGPKGERLSLAQCVKNREFRETESVHFRVAPGPTLQLLNEQAEREWNLRVGDAVFPSNLFMFSLRVYATRFVNTSFPPLPFMFPMLGTSPYGQYFYFIPDGLKPLSGVLSQWKMLKIGVSHLLSVDKTPLNLTPQRFVCDPAQRIYSLDEIESGPFDRLRIEGFLKELFPDSVERVVFKLHLGFTGDVPLIRFLTTAYLAGIVGKRDWINDQSTPSSQWNEWASAIYQEQHPLSAYFWEHVDQIGVSHLLTAFLLAYLEQESWMPPRISFEAVERFKRLSLSYDFFPKIDHKNGLRVPTCVLKETFLGEGRLEEYLIILGAVRQQGLDVPRSPAAS